MVLYARTADLAKPMPPRAPPRFRACVTKGTDLTQLAKANLDLTEAGGSCEAFGAGDRPPRALVDAYPDLFRVPMRTRAKGVSGAGGPPRTRLLTRDVGG